MNLHSHEPYFLMRNGVVTTYPSLQEDINIDVAIVGAGISGALVAYYLRNSGLKIAVFDRRHAGTGSTAASTSFLQYEIDTPLHELIQMVGEKNAVRSYELCRDAIYKLQNICKAVKQETEFSLLPSLQYASYQKHVSKLQEEYNTRRKYGFGVQWLEETDVHKTFGFNAPAAILSNDGGEVDVYMLTHHLLYQCHKKQHGIYSNTNIANITNHTNGSATLQTDKGHKIKTRHVVIASGYESLKYIPKQVAQIHTTYALVSEPIANNTFWKKKSIVWETANPYMYFRVVDKNRVLVGGRDDEHHKPNLPHSRINQKAELLQQAFNKKLPHIPILPDFSWCGAFAVTKDGLPYIDSLPRNPNTHFALGFGGNGITFSVIAAQVIKDKILGKKNTDAGIFSFNR